MTTWLAPTWRVARGVYFFVRIPLVGFTALLPLLGAASAGRVPTAAQILGLLAVALAFHAYAYVLNDIIDLPIDRTESLRADYPLVRGSIQPSQALVCVVLQVPAAVLITFVLGGNTLAYAALGVSFVLITVYDLWGKRTPMPILMDWLQGVGWGGLVVFGAAIVGGEATQLTAVTVVFVTVFIGLLNGVHGGLRDLANDISCGARTTAIVLGARPRGVDGLMLPAGLMAYALVLQLLLTAVTLLPLAGNWFLYDAATWTFVFTVTGVMTALEFVLLAIATRVTARRWDMIYAGTWHLVVCLTSVVVLFAPYADRGLMATLIGVHCVPLVTSGWLYTAIVRARQSWSIGVSLARGTWRQTYR